MNKYFYPTFLLVLCLFFYGKYYFDPNSQSERLSNKLIARTGSRLAKEYNLSIGAIGGGGGGEKGIRLLTVGFVHHGKPFSINDARRLIITLTKEFLNDINSDMALRPYLASFPFTLENIDVYVIFYDSKGNFIFDPYLITVSTFKDEIGYFTKSPENLYGYKNEYFEPYEEALAIVNKEKMEGTNP